MASKVKSVGGVVFDIQRFALYDGPGIRTLVFLKGCPLRCWWCQNPEGLTTRPSLVYLAYKCIRCKTCLAACKKRALLFDEENKVIRFNRELCELCGTCARLCPTTAIRLVGKVMTVEEVMNEIERDIPFYDASGGGVTFSGGEPLMQPNFLVRLLEACRSRGVHTAIETSGYAPTSVFKKVLNLVDLLLFDIKLADDVEHTKYTGVSNKPILNNLLYANSAGKPVIIRIPVIPTITDTDKNVLGIEKILSLLNLSKVIRVDLLPYHDVKEKYERLGLEYKMPSVQRVSEDRLNYIKERIEKLGLRVTIGGSG